MTSLGGHSGSSAPAPLNGEAAAAAAALILEELLPRLFPAGLSSEETGEGFISPATAATTVQVQQSVFALPMVSRWPPSSERGTVSGAYSSSSYSSVSAEEERSSPTGLFQLLPPSITGVSPGVLCCQSFLPLASDSVTDRSSRRIELLLQLSSPLPEEGVTVLARYRSGFLDARFLPLGDAPGSALHVRVRMFLCVASAGVHGISCSAYSILIQPHTCVFPSVVNAPGLCAASSQLLPSSWHALPRSDAQLHQPAWGAGAAAAAAAQ